MISIIIPIYNVEQYITACLESIVVQTYTDYEVILVDDCGTDRSMEIAEGFINANQNCWRIIHHEKNRGLSAARNTGTAVAKGKYIYYLDSDDTITQDCLEKLVAEAERTEAEMVVGNIQVIIFYHPQVLSYVEAPSCVIVHVHGNMDECSNVTFSHLDGFAGLEDCNK